MNYPISRLIWLPLLKAIFIKDISGTENLPKKAPFLIVANHQGNLDAYLLAIPFLKKYRNKLRYVALAEAFHDWRAIFVIPFGSIKQNSAVEKALKALKKGNIIGIFPEGGRTYTGKIQKIEHSGAAVIAVLGKVPVVPVGIKGSFEVWPRQKAFPRFKKIVELRIGKPISVKRYYNKKLTRAQYLRLTKQFMKEVEKLMR